MLDIRQTREYANYLRKIGWEVERIGESYYFVKKIPILGTILKIQRPNKLSNKTISFLEDKYKPFQIIVEPLTDIHNQLLALGFKEGKSPYLPTKTLQISLNQPIIKIFSQVKKDARSAIRKNANLDLLTDPNLDSFRRDWRKAVSFRRYVPPLTHLQALKKVHGSSALFLTSHNGEAGAIFLKTKDTAYYWQAFTSHEGRKSLLQYKIVWEGINWARKSGCKIFDFEGIFDERFPLPSWRGFTHFKRSFGGLEVSYPGCFIKTNWGNIMKRLLFHPTK